MKQLTIPQIMDCTVVYPNGTEQRCRLGQYEAFMITHENGRRIPNTVPAIVPQELVIEVTRSDGIRIVFDNPWYRMVRIDL